MFLSFFISLNSISFSCSSLLFFLLFFFIIFFLLFNFFYYSSDCLGRCGSHGPLFRPPLLHPPSLMLIPIFTSSNNSREINWEKRRERERERENKERDSSDIFPGLENSFLIEARPLSVFFFFPFVSFLIFGCFFNRNRMQLL